MTTSTATDTAVALRGISKVYQTKHGGTVVALRDVDIDVQQGQFVSIVGPSGCGKSSLLKLILGQSRPTQGSIEFGDGLDNDRHKLGMVFQQSLLLPWKTVAGNLLLSQELNGNAKKADSRQRATEMLKLLGLSEFADKYPSELSGGMQQRVGIGRALMHDPQILMMDEPFGALDAMTRDQMGMDLLEIWDRDRKTVLFVTHSIPEAVLLSDRVVVMTPRPGEVAEIIDVDLARPRALENINTPAFGDIVHRIRVLLGVDKSAH